MKLSVLELSNRSGKLSSNNVPDVGQQEQNEAHSIASKINNEAPATLLPFESVMATFSEYFNIIMQNVADAEDGNDTNNATSNESRTNSVSVCATQADVPIITSVDESKDSTSNSDTKKDNSSSNDQQSNNLINSGNEPPQNKKKAALSTEEVDSLFSGSDSDTNSDDSEQETDTEREQRLTVDSRSSVLGSNETAENSSCSSVTKEASDSSHISSDFSSNNNNCQPKDINYSLEISPNSTATPNTSEATSALSCAVPPVVCVNLVTTPHSLPGTSVHIF